MGRGIPSAFAGNAGEFFVLAELTRRGWTAGLTARNNRAYDILAKRDNDFAAIRVKTKSSASDAFRWNAKPSGELFLDAGSERDLCVLVDIPEDDNLGPTYYVVPTPVIDKWLKDDFAAWLLKPGRKGPHDPDNRQRIIHLGGSPTRIGCGYRLKLAPYKGAWASLTAAGHKVPAV